MASIHKRGRFWRAEVCRRNVRTSRTFNTKADAEAWANHIDSEIRRGIFIDRTEAERTTLGEALERYCREITSRKKSVESETRRIRVWLRNPLAKNPLALLRGSDFAKYRDQRRADGAAENTIRLDLAIISHLFETARREWGMESLANPLRNIHMPRGSKHRDRRLVDDEEERLLAALSECRDSWIKPLVQTAIETGMRQGELLALRWEHVDLKRRIAHLPATKNGEIRNVPLSSRITGELQKIPRAIAGRVFPTTRSALVQAFERAINRARRKYEAECKTAGVDSSPKLLRDLRFHDLRHEATSRFFELGLNVMEVAAITGHKTLQMLKRYTHLRAEDLAKKLG